MPRPTGSNSFGKATKYSRQPNLAAYSVRHHYSAV
jgi:hypothetical protein